jgi:hypothetical protein
MKTLGGLVAALFLLTACGDKSDQVPLDDLVPDATVAPESALAFEDADWDGWAPVYGEMRPADETAVAEIAARVTALNASSWTAHESTTDAEISYTPEHVRLRSDYLDLHFTPAEDVRLSEMTACLEDGCSELDPSDDNDTKAEGLVESVRGAAFVFPVQLGLLEEIEEPLDEGMSAISTVDSPAGPVDCLVVAQTQRDLDGLVGRPMERHADGDTFVGWCVDQRGLVLVGTSTSWPVPLYDAWRPDVDGDVTELVAAPEVTEAPVDPTGDFEDVLWAVWEEEFRDAHTATDAEVQALEDRVSAFNETSWTGVLGGYGATMSVTPRHVRVGMGFGEWHFDTVGSPFKTPYVLCLHDEEQCVRVGKDAEVPEGSPHLFNNDLDSMTFTWLMALGTQRAGLASPTGDPPVLATIDSPVGPLDCLVDGLDAAELDVDALASLMTSTQESVICVDQRGLVQLSTGGMLGAQGQYTSWHAGVDDGFDEIPYKVRDYND